MNRSACCAPVVTRLSYLSAIAQYHARGCGVQIRVAHRLAVYTPRSDSMAPNTGTFGRIGDDCFRTNRHISSSTLVGRDGNDIGNRR